IEHGHLFPRASADPAAFVPWLTAQQDHHFVPKYAPVFPAMLAIGRWVFGTERAALALIAAGVILVTYLLATEILERREHAAHAQFNHPQPRSLLRMPVSIIASRDTLGFDTRAMDPNNPAMRFTSSLR